MQDVYEGFGAYQVYLAVKQHFTVESYDFFKYNGKIKTSSTAYLKRPDRFKFAKLQSKYRNREDLVAFFVANTIEQRGTGWVGDFTEANYLKWQKRQQALTYTLSQQIKYLTDKYTLKEMFVTGDSSSHPKIMQEHLQSNICPELVVVFNNKFKFIELLSKRIDDIMWQKWSQNINKYSPFVKYDDKKINELMRCLYTNNTI